MLEMQAGNVRQKAKYVKEVKEAQEAQKNEGVGRESTV